MIRRDVHQITPAPRANGKALREVFRRWRGHVAFDDSFAAHVAEAREVASADLDNDPGRD
jgi:hypothetical protein